MAVKMYEVIANKFVGKHRVYKKGKLVPETEIMGGDAGKKLALEGQKGLTRSYPTDGKDSKPRKLKDVAPALKVATKTVKK